MMVAQHHQLQLMVARFSLLYNGTSKHMVVSGLTGKPVDVYYRAAEVKGCTG